MLYRKLFGVFVAALTVMTVGLTGYMLIEGWSPLEAVYMTVITLSTVGFMEVHPLSGPGRIFTMFLIVCGSGVIVYGISIVTAFIVEGELTDVLRRRKMNKKIGQLRGHYIVCGADQTGRYVIEELEKTKRDFVVIEKDPEKIRNMMQQDLLCVEGDATQDAVLIQAGITLAKGFITSLPSDAENLFAVITAKRLNPTLRVVSKAIEEESEQKIRSVGADGVVMPNYIGGLRMVSEVIRPSVVNFLDIMLREKDRTVRIEEIDLEKGNPFIGQSIESTGIRSIEGISLVALKEVSSHRYVFNPSSRTILKEDSIMVVMGDVETISDVRKKMAPHH